VTCVASSDRQAKFSDFSNWGPEVAIIAPGTDIVAASIQDDQLATPRSGTSYAAPVVAGIMSIFVSYENINNNVAMVLDRLTRNALTDYITDVPQGTKNLFVQSGINNGNNEIPYAGAPPQELVLGNGPQATSAGTVNHITTQRQYCLLNALAHNLVR